MSGSEVPHACAGPLNDRSPAPFVVAWLMRAIVAVPDPALAARDAAQETLKLTFAPSTIIDCSGQLPSALASIVMPAPLEVLLLVLLPLVDVEPLLVLLLVDMPLELLVVELLLLPELVVEPLPLPLVLPLLPPPLPPSSGVSTLLPLPLLHAAPTAAPIASKPTATPCATRTPREPRRRRMTLFLPRLLRRASARTSGHGA
jgi:hypothetical protein